MHKPIVPWMGGKRRLAKSILPLFPNHKCYVEPFCGGAALFFMKEPSKVEVLNDIDGELVNLYRVVRHHLGEFLQQFRWALASRRVFEWAKATDVATLTDIQRAARFYYLQKLCFGAKPVGRTFGTSAVSPPRINLLRIEEELSAAHLRLARVTVEHLDWRDCLQRYDRPTTLFYIDPPYLGLSGYGPAFGEDELSELAGDLRNLAGRAIVSMNDDPAVRRIFRGFRRKRLAVRYSVGSDRSKQSQELLIRTWRD